MRARGVLLVGLMVLAAACESSDPSGVEEPFVARVEVDPATASLVVGQTVGLTARAKTSAGDVMEGVQIVWSSDQTDYATVAAQGTTGRVTAVAAGTATIRATAGSRSGTATITVTEPAPGPVDRLELGVDSVALEEGDVHQLTATAYDADGRVVTGPVAQWTSSDPGVVAIEALGKVTAIRPGRAVVTARMHGRTATLPVRVTSDWPYELVFSGWSGVPGEAARRYRVDLNDPDATSVADGPDLGQGASPWTPSPDGSRILYMGGMGNVLRTLHVADADGGSPRTIFSTTDPGCGPFVWSPDGERIAFACRIGDDDLDIWVMDAEDGGSRVNLTDAVEGRQEWPAWSPVRPDGTYRIAYQQFRGDESGLWTVNDDGTDPDQITSGIDTQPAWSPDGTTIAFQRTGLPPYGDLWLVDADGGNERGLIGWNLAGAQWTPTWSPDGRLIAFASTHETFGSGATISQIYTVWADGSKVARRTSGTLDKHGPVWRMR